MEQTIENKVNKLVKLVSELSPQSVEGPTLVYFNIVGIAWPIRCLLHIHNIDYRYIPISIFEWMYQAEDGSQPLKATFENGHVPLYLDQDISLNQSNVILKMLAQKTAMMGRSEKEAIAIEVVLAHCYDSLFHWNGMLGVNIRLNISDEVAQERLNSFMGDGVWGVVTNGYRNHLQAFVKFLKANPSQNGFMVGDRLSVADLSAFNVLCNWYKAFDRQVFVQEFSVLEEYIQRIALTSGIADYIREVQEPTLWFELPTVAMRLTSPQDLQGLVSLA